ncbi:MAG: hypothetical protein M3424_08340 [Actinomycetota bacterium]|nr:hypothetical protein [Actinomycetota bacterium]
MSSTTRSPSTLALTVRRRRALRRISTRGGGSSGEARCGMTQEATALDKGSRGDPAQAAAGADTRGATCGLGS